VPFYLFAFFPNTMPESETITLNHGDDPVSKTLSNAQVFYKVEVGMLVQMSGAVRKVWEPNGANTVIRIEASTGLVIDALCGGVLVDDQRHEKGTRMIMRGAVTDLDPGNMRLGMMLENMEVIPKPA
jgi:hypothetical protein